MKISVKVEIFVAKDKHGNFCSAVTDDRANDIQLCGLKNAAGEEVYYENDAWGFEHFCRENGIDYKVVEKTESIEL